MRSSLRAARLNFCLMFSCKVWAPLQHAFVMSGTIEPQADFVNQCVGALNGGIVQEEIHVAICA